MTSSWRVFLPWAVVLGTLVIAFTANGGDEGAAALERARSAVLDAPYLQVGQTGGRRRLLLSARSIVIAQNGRVLAWRSGDEEFTLRSSGRCYERYTDFNRGDIVGQRRGVAPPLVADVSLRERNGREVVSGRERHMDFADTEFEVFLDRSGRPERMRQRSARNGVVAPSRWNTTTYRYLSRSRFRRLTGEAPTPRCR